MTEKKEEKKEDNLLALLAEGFVECAEIVVDVGAAALEGAGDVIGGLADL
jgi:hypothetical protein